MPNPFFRLLIAGIAVSFIHLSFAGPIIIADGKNNIDYSGWANYAASLDTCSPNTFNLPDPFEINILQNALQAIQAQNSPQASQAIQTIGYAIAHAVITYTIYGWNQNNCLVNIKRIISPPPEASGNEPATTINMNCSFTKTDLPILAQAAQLIASGSSDPSGQSQANQILSQACTDLQQAGS